MINLNSLTISTTESVDLATHVGSNTTTTGGNPLQEGSVLTTFQALSIFLAHPRPPREAPLQSNPRIRALDPNKSVSVRQLTSSSASFIFQTHTSSSSSLLSSHISPSQEPSAFSDSSFLNASIASEDSARQSEILRQLEKTEDELEQQLTEALERLSEDPGIQNTAKEILFKLTHSGKQNLSEYWISILNESLSLGDGSNQFKLENLLFVATLKTQESSGVIFSDKTTSFLRNCFTHMRDSLSRNRFSQLIAEKPEIFIEPLAKEVEWKLGLLQTALHEHINSSVDPCGRENGILNHFLASLSPRYSWEAVDFLNTEGYLAGNFSKIEKFLSAYLETASELISQDSPAITPTHIKDLQLRVCSEEQKITKILDKSLPDIESMIEERLQQLHQLETKTENERLTLERERQKIEQEKEHTDYQKRFQHWSTKYNAYLASGPPFLKMVINQLTRELQTLENQKHILGENIRSIERDLWPLRAQLSLAEIEYHPQLREIQSQKFHLLAKAAGLESLSEE